MALPEEAYAEGRGSVQERLLPYAAHRMRSVRTTAIHEPRRFFALVVGVYACVCASTGYVFNLFSGQLQEKYDFSQRQMATITTLASLLGVVTFPLAGVYDYYGPRPLFLIGMTTFPLGAVLFGLAFSDVIQGTVPLLTIFNALLLVGTGMFDIGGLMTIMSVFPSSRGAVIAVMKTFIGLGSAIFGAIQLGFFEFDVSGFFYFMAAFVAVVGVFAVFFIELPPYHLTGYEEAHLTPVEKRKRLDSRLTYFEQVPPARRFGVAFVLVAVFIVFLPIQSTLVAFLDMSHAWKVTFAVATITVLLLYGVIALPLRWLDGGSESITGRIAAGGNEDDVSPRMGGDDSLHVSPADLQRASSRVAGIMASTRGSIMEEAMFSMPIIDESEHIAPQYQTCFLESLTTLKLWALSYSLFCIGGTQMVVIVNARFIYSAVAEEPISASLTTLLTVINGVGSALGRILMSAFEIWTQKRQPAERIPLTASIFIPTVAVLLSSSLLLVAPRQLLLIPFILCALGNGFTAASVVLVMRTLYAKDIANHYNFTSVATIASAILLNKLLYGNWYTKEAERQGSTLCKGRSCIFVPFAVMSLLALSSLLSNLYVHLQYKGYCQAVLEERQAHWIEHPTAAPVTIPTPVGESEVEIADDERAPLLGR